MRTHKTHHRILLICVLLLGGGALRADVTNPKVPAPPPGSRIKKDTGLFSRLFGRKAERVDAARPIDNDNDNDEDDDDNDDDHQRSRQRFTTTTQQTPAPVRYFDADRSSHPQRETRNPPPSAWGASSAPQQLEPTLRTQVPQGAVVENNPRLQAGEPVRTVVAPAKMKAPPASRPSPPSPTRPAATAATDVRETALFSHPASQDASSSVTVPASAAKAPATPRASNSSAGSAALAAVSSSPVAEQNPVSSPPSQGSQPDAQEPAPVPDIPFAKPVPGRPGFAYPPGREAIPENMIDVSGYASGTKVRDPDSKMVFRVP